MSNRTLIRGGCVLTLGKTPNLTEADVLVDDGKVAEVGPRLRAREAEVVDATDTIVMPGFVDTHRHTWQSLFRNAGQAGADPAPVPVYGPNYAPEDLYAGTLVGLLGAIEAGITTVVDWSDIQIDESYTEAALQAHADAGLRTVFVHASPHWAGEGPEPGEGIRRAAAASAPGPLTVTAVGVPGPWGQDPGHVEDEWAAARRSGLRIHTHVGSSPEERGVVADLRARGLLREDVTLVHCSHLDDADLDAVASSGANVSLTPASEMAGGLGAPPMQKLIDRGIRPGLGIDREGLAPGDMFAQMRAAISIQHATLFDLKLTGKGGVPRLLTTREVIRYATVDGARVAGLRDVTGSLDPGMAADILVLRTDRPNIWPINDPIGAVVWGMDTSNIDWVFVGGRALVRDGRLEADVERARKLAVEAQRRVAAASGLMVPTGPGSPA